LEHCIQNSSVMCQHIITAFLNLEKVYDTRQYSILRTLHKTLILLSSLHYCHFSDSAVSFVLPVNMKMECQRTGFKYGPVHYYNQWDGQSGWSISLSISVC
jgi:hypothetical protein